jgi:hypothetical protein
MSRLGRSFPNHLRPARPFLTASTAVAGSATLVAASSLTTAGSNQVNAAATLAAASSLTTGGANTAVATATLAATATLTSAGSNTAIAAATLAATSSLTVSAAVPTSKLLWTAEGGTNGSTIAFGDTGNGDAFDVAGLVSGGIRVYSNTHALAGALSARFSTGATAGTNFLGWTTSLYPSGAAAGHLYIEALFYFTAAPAAAVVLLAGRNGANNDFSIQLATTGKLQLRDANNVVQATFSNSVPFNQAHPGRAARIHRRDRRHHRGPALVERDRRLRFRARSPVADGAEHRHRDRPGARRHSRQPGERRELLGRQRHGIDVGLPVGTGGRHGDAGRDGDNDRRRARHHPGRCNFGCRFCADDFGA